MRFLVSIPVEHETATDDGVPESQFYALGGHFVQDLKTFLLDMPSSEIKMSG